MSVKSGLLDVLMQTYQDKVVDRASNMPRHFKPLAAQVTAQSIQLYKTATPNAVHIPDVHRERINLPCAYLGNWVQPCPSGDIHACECEDHEFDRCRPRSIARQDDIQSCLLCDWYSETKYEDVAIGPVGVAIGCYGWPRLAEVQVQLIRQHNGDVPILVCDDGSPFAAEFAELSERLQVTVQRNDPRLGHYAGDVSAFRKAALWGRAQGLDYVAKVSQRMLLDKPGWLARAARYLSGCKRTTLASGCIDNGYDLYVRSELVLMNVATWSTPGVLESLDKRKLHNPAELHVNHVIQTMLGGKVDWPGLPRKRYVKADGFVWHCTNKREEFQAIADRFGITLEDDFHVGGAEGTAKQHAGTWLAWERG